MAKEKYFSQPVIVAVKAIKKHIDGHPANGQSSALLAARAGISRNVLQEAFKEFYGTDIRMYKLRLRMQLAQRLLTEGRSIKEIYLTLNYSSPSTFTKAFKNFFYVTPTAWIKSHNETTDYPVKKVING
jgi:AraC-like DNA-binding protein